MARLALAIGLGLTGCGGGSSDGASPPDAQTPTLNLTMSPEFGVATLARVARITTSEGAAAVSAGPGATVRVPPASASPLVLATDADGRLLLAALADQGELSATSTAVALLWMWVKPVAPVPADDRAFAALATRLAGFERLRAEVRTAVNAGTSPVASPSVLAALNDAALALGAAVAEQAGPLQAGAPGNRVRALGEIARPRLTAFQELLRAEDPVTGNLFVNATGNLGVFNGTALHWSATVRSFDGAAVGAPVLLSPVGLTDARRFEAGARPDGGYQHVPGHATVSYDLRVLQDTASRRANAVMVVRKAMEALLGSAALAFGDSAGCLNSFIAAVAPAELDAVAAGADAAAVEAYLAAYHRALATASLESLVLSAPCASGSTLLTRLARHLPLLQLGLRVYEDAFAKTDAASQVGEAAGTWVVLAENFALAHGDSHTLGVCVAGGSVTPCATRYELADDRPWLEGAWASLSLTAFDARGLPTLVPSTLRIASASILPLLATPDSVIQVLGAGEARLRLSDEPTGHDSDALRLRIEPGEIRYSAALGGAIDGPFLEGDVRHLIIVAGSDPMRFHGDVSFEWRLATGSDSVVELTAGGSRLASVKALRAGLAVVEAINAVTGRKLEFLVGVEAPAAGHWELVYQINSCSGDEGYGWAWMAPCFAAYMPMALPGNASSTPTYRLYFDDVSAEVVFEADDVAGDLRSFKSLSWRSDQDLFELQQPYEQPLDLGPGQRTVRFVVEERHATLMRGRVEGQFDSGYFLNALTRREIGSVASKPTTATGRWTAVLRHRPRPVAPWLDGQAWCSSSGTGSEGRACVFQP